MSIIPRAPYDYPADLPPPRMTPYNWGVGLGISSLKVNSGGTLIRRIWRNLPHTFNFVFELTTDEMTRFVYFVDAVGVNWFNLPSTSMYTSAEMQVVEDQPVRFIGNMDITEAGYDRWTVTIPAELSPDVFRAIDDSINDGKWIIAWTPSNASKMWVYAGNVVYAQQARIIAGRPRTPSSSNRYIAGRPGAEAVNRVIPRGDSGYITTDWVLAGTPGMPAAYVLGDGPNG